MNSSLLEQLDQIIERAGCRLSIEEIGDVVFGGALFSRKAKPLIAEVTIAGLALRKSEAFPFATPVPSEIGLFLVAISAERLSDFRITEGEGGIDRVRRRLEKIERKHGVEDGLVPWRLNEAPANWQAANQEFERISDELLVDALDPHAPEIAELIVVDRQEFDRRREVGRRNFALLVGRDDLVRLAADMHSELLDREEQSAA